jgi:hypothetical protein
LRPEVFFNLFFKSSSFVLRSLLKIDEPPAPNAAGCYFGASPRFPRGIICGREGAAFMPVESPRPKPPRALNPVPGGLGSGFGSRGGFSDELGG